MTQDPGPRAAKIKAGCRDLNSVGDRFAGTRVVHDADQILPRYAADRATF